MENLQYIEWLLSEPRSNSLCAKPTKHTFGLNELEYLGCIISNSTAKQDPKKTKATSPINLKELQVFLSFCNYYGHFVYYFSDIVGPFYTLLHKEATWHWTEPEESAICSLCTTLCSNPVLALPDFTKVFQIESNASDTTIGILFTQQHISVEKPLLTKY